jgi:hypothetical protein
MSLRNRVIILLVALVGATAIAVGGRVGAHAQPAAPAASSCGVQRWASKTLTDAAARSVNLTPRLSTIGALGRIAPPTVFGLRFGATERTNFRIRVRLLSAKIEADGDVHLVIASPSSGRTMIAEFPSLACTGLSLAAARMQTARAAFETACGVQSRSGFTTLTGTATVTGVGFFDFKHHQRGVAPNGIELHPVLRFSATGCRPAPSPPPPSVGDCAPSYPTVCIAPPPPDLNCADVPHNDFTVLWTVPDPDPHHFDGNHDGVGCET